MIPYIKTFAISFLIGLTLFSLGWYVFVYGGLIPSIGAAILMLGFFWVVCHQMGWIYNPPETPWVDLGWTLVASVMAWAWVKFHANPVEAVPMLILTCCGALLGTLGVFLMKPVLRKILTALILNNKKEDDQ